MHASFPLRRDSFRFRRVGFLVLSGFTIATVTVAPARGQGEIWTRLVTSQNYDEVSSVAVNHVGLFMGGSTATLDSPPRWHIDCIVRRYDTDGNSTWARRYNYSIQEYVSSVAVDETSVYVLGWGYFGSVPTATTFLSRRSFDGTELWNRQFAGAYGVIPRELVVDESGVYIAGSRLDSAHLTDHLFLRRYDLDGNLVWEKGFPQVGVFGGIGGMAIDAGGIFICGGNDAAGSTIESGFLRKYDRDGNVLWVKDYAEIIRDIAIWGSSLYACERTHDSGVIYGIVAKMDLAANPIWQRRLDPLPSIGPDFPAVELDAVTADDGGVYVTGSYYRGGVNLNDALVQRYSPGGTLVWSTEVVTPLFDFGLDIAVDESGVYVGGIQGLDNTSPTLGPGSGFLKKLERGSFIVADLDVRPGSCENPLGPTPYMGGPSLAKGVLPVALLGSEDFDVNDVDPSTVTIGEAVPKRFLLADVSGPAVDESACACPSAGADGFDDLVFQFRSADVIAGLGDATSGAVRTVTLSGKLNDGTPFDASDCVRIVGKPTGQPLVLTSRGGDGPLLGRANPNPFNPRTRIDYILPQEGMVRLNVYDAAGHLVTHLVDEQEAAGAHIVDWDASGQPSGLYFYRLEFAGHSETGKMVLLK